MNIFLSQFLYLFTSFLVIPLLTVSGIYFSIRLRFLQISKIKEAFSLLFDSGEQAQGDVSHFQAISTVLAGNLGTGNISGMAVAIATGGPGALLWMWIMAFFGAILKYAGCFLGVYYRKRNLKGEYVGGPMYYLSEGAGSKVTAAAFAIMATLAAFCTGNFVQVNSIVLPLAEAGIDPLFVALVTAAFVAIVLLGGEHRIALVASAVVPFMAFSYILVALVILYLFADKIPEAFYTIYSSAFSFSSCFSGACGYTITTALTVGVERGLFATDAGVGIAPVLQAGAKTKNPVQEGIVAMVAPIVVMVICTITSLVLIVTGAFSVEGLQSTNMCTWAFTHGISHAAAGYVVIVSLILFAFTTILAWAFCAERAIEYLFGEKGIWPFRILYILLIPVGTYAQVETIWLLADFAMGAMCITNICGLLRLRNIVMENTIAYLSE